MPRCSYHAGVETSLRCVECDRPICPKEMVTTAVGYKCPDCARTPHNSLGGAKPRQYLGALAAGAAAAIIAGLVLSYVPLRFGFFGLLAAILFGALVAEATRRGAGGHRTPPFAAIAGALTFAGAVLGRFSILQILIAVGAAALSLLGGRL